MSEVILTERRGTKDGILWITLNRPEKMNALTFPLLKDMREILIDARFDRSVRCIVITGAGRGFCAGMDMGGNANPDAKPKPAAPTANVVDPEGYRLNFRNETETYIALKRMEVPIIAMVSLCEARRLCGPGWILVPAEDSGLAQVNGNDDDGPLHECRGGPRIGSDQLSG
jgi:enoyl-CoA hydratase/carnithine racemase